MSTQAVGYKTSIYDLYSNERRGMDATQAGAGNASTSSDSRFGADIRAKIDALLADVPRDATGKLTFDAIIDYRDQYRAAFEARTKIDLSKLGVDTDADMTFSYDATADKLTVDSSHPDKDVIDNYFEENEDARHMFAKLVVLTKITNMAERKLSPVELKTEMQLQAMSWWTQANVQNIFSGGNLSYTEGNEAPVFYGLDTLI